MNIPFTLGKGKTSLQAHIGPLKAHLGRIPKDVLTVAVFVLATSGSFGLGILAGRDQVLSKGQGSDFTTLKATAAAGAAVSPNTDAKTGTYVASKNGTKYYLPSCSGAKILLMQIKSTSPR
jgi:hypothetical protein